MNRNIFWWRAIGSAEWIPAPSAGNVGPLMWHVCPAGLSAEIFDTRAASGRFLSPDFGEVEWTLGSGQRGRTPY